MAKVLCRLDVDKTFWGGSWDGSRDWAHLERCIISGIILDNSVEGCRSCRSESSGKPSQLHGRSNPDPPLFTSWSGSLEMVNCKGAD